MTKTLVHDTLTNISNEETFLQDFVVILKRTLQNYYKILKKCFLCTAWTVMLSTGTYYHSMVNTTYTPSLSVMRVNIKETYLYLYVHEERTLLQDCLKISEA